MDSLAEKLASVCQIGVVKYCLNTIGSVKTVEVVGCPLLRGCLSIKVNGTTVGTIGIVSYIMGVRY